MHRPRVPVVPAPDEPRPAFGRRRMLQAGAAWLGLAGLARGAPAPSVLPAPASIAAEAAAAGARGRALVVLVSLHGCPWCKLVRESYLLPLRREGQPVVQVDLGEPTRVQDGQGAVTSHAALVRAWGVRVAPTVLFLGRGGRELAPRLVGVPSQDFYGAYLDQRIAAANAAAAAG